MSNGFALTLDCIIFGLQRFGGISSYWAQLGAYTCRHPSWDTRLLLPKRVSYQEFDARTLQAAAVTREWLPSRLSRWLPAPSGVRDGIFHTSYYRTPSHRVRKFVVTAYDFTYERYRGGTARVAHSTQKWRSIRRADAVICISEATRRDVIEYCPQVDAACLHVVHLGVNRQAFFPDPAPSPPAHGHVLFVGQRGDYKRFDLAVHALRQLPRMSLGIVGPALDDSERLMLQRTLGSRWREHGPIGTPELRQLYSSSFAFIFPSDYEGFGLPMLEAMACGCPVVAAARSSLPEVGGGAARYAAQQSAEAYAQQLQALESDALRTQTLRDGLQHVDAFTWARTFAQTDAIYRA
jgi:mannosyltransferase